MQSVTTALKQMRFFVWLYAFTKLCVALMQASRALHKDFCLPLLYTSWRFPVFCTELMFSRARHKLVFPLILSKFDSSAFDCITSTNFVARKSLNYVSVFYKNI